MTRSYERLPKPLRDELVAGRCVPIIGSGFSKNAHCIDGEMPNWVELAHEFGADLSLDLTGTDDPIEILSSYEHEHGRVYLAQRLQQLLHQGGVYPGAVHRAFARVPFRYVITTNFDTLLEDAYRDDSIDYFQVVDESQLSVASDLSSRVLIKLHGDIHRPDTIVISEADFDNFLTQHPLLSTEVASLLVRRTGILIGYSLADPNLRQILAVLRNRLGRLMRPLYAITVRANPADVARFERRMVRVVDLGLADGQIQQGFIDLFESMSSAARSGGVQAIVDSRTRVADEFEEATQHSAVAYFSVPRDRLPLYRDFFFPVASEAGLTSSSADDIPPSDVVLAAVEGLIARSFCVVSEPANGQLRTELEFARRSDVPVFLVEPSHLQSNAESMWLKAASDFRVWLDQAGAVHQQRDRLLEEPQRLLKKKEYRAAVVSAVALLETELTRRMARSGSPERGASFVWLVRVAADRSIIPPRFLVDLEWAAHIRNHVVHGFAAVTRHDAERVVRFVSDLVEHLKSEESISSLACGAEHSNEAP